MVYMWRSEDSLWLVLSFYHMGSNSHHQAWWQGTITCWDISLALILCLSIFFFIQRFYLEAYLRKRDNTDHETHVEELAREFFFLIVK